MTSDRRSCRLPPKKLLDSKWTAVAPEDGEKHFIATRVLASQDTRAGVPSVELRCLLTKRSCIVAQADLENRERWRQGWLSDDLSSRD